MQTGALEEQLIKMDIKRRGNFFKWHIDRGTKIPGSELIDCGEDCSKGIENLSARRKDVSGCGV